MKHLPANTATDVVIQNQDTNESLPKIDKVVDKVATAVVATTIIQSGRGVFGALAKNPWVMFGLGLTTGYMVHKYRKEILTLSKHTAEQGKDFLLRQQQELNKLLSLQEKSPKSDDAP